MSFFITQNALCAHMVFATIPLVAERAQEKTPTRYLLTREQMIENDYPIPSYIADVFEKQEGWKETPEPSSDDVADARILAIDCEMVRISPAHLFQ